MIVGRDSFGIERFTSRVVAQVAFGVTDGFFNGFAQAAQSSPSAGFWVVFWRSLSTFCQSDGMSSEISMLLSVVGSKFSKWLRISLPESCAPLVPADFHAFFGAAEVAHGEIGAGGGLADARGGGDGQDGKSRGVGQPAHLGVFVARENAGAGWLLGRGHIGAGGGKRDKNHSQEQADGQDGGDRAGKSQFDEILQQFTIIPKQTVPNPAGRLRSFLPGCVRGRFSTRPAWPR